MCDNKKENFLLSTKLSQYFLCQQMKRGAKRKSILFYFILINKRWHFFPVNSFIFPIVFPMFVSCMESYSCVWWRVFVLKQWPWHTLRQLTSLACFTGNKEWERTGLTLQSQLQRRFLVSSSLINWMNQREMGSYTHTKKTLSQIFLRLFTCGFGFRFRTCLSDGPIRLLTMLRSACFHLVEPLQKDKKEVHLLPCFQSRFQ